MKTTMTKEDLEFVRDNHEVNKKSHDDHATCGYNYEDGYVDALNFVLKHLDELCEGVHGDEFMWRATEEAKYYIREYFQNKYNCGWSRDEVEDHIWRAIDNGDAKTIANYFIEIVSEGFLDTTSRKNIVRNFYN